MPGPLPTALNGESRLRLIASHRLVEERQVGDAPLCGHDRQPSANCGVPPTLSPEEIAVTDEQKTAFNRGVAARQDGFSRSVCPYVANDPLREWWLSGWKSGK